MVSGEKGPEFWDHQWVIALLHVKRGVNNLFMLGIMNRVQQLFLEKSLASFDDKVYAMEVFGAFQRLSGIISAMIAECYGVVMERSTSDGLSRVGLNLALLERIKGMQIKKMLDANDRGG